jgi:hypothetical protein
MSEEIKYDDKLRGQIKDLTLMLLYLNSWTDRDFGQESRRSWKGYDFDDLNALAEEGYISEGRRSKSVLLYEEGIEKAKELLASYGINIDGDS